jgi:hypothetical protein
VQQTAAEPTPTSAPVTAPAALQQAQAATGPKAPVACSTAAAIAAAKAAKAAATSSPEAGAPATARKATLDSEIPLKPGAKSAESPKNSASPVILLQPASMSKAA